MSLALYDNILYDTHTDVKRKPPVFSFLRRSNPVQEKKSLSRQTAERLYSMIVVEGRLAPGEKLPNEVELARELGVSRTTLRLSLIHI